MFEDPISTVEIENKSTVILNNYLTFYLVPPSTTTVPPDTTTSPPDTTTGPPDTTTAPPTTPPFCLSNRQPVTQEEVANSVSLIIPNLSIPEWCPTEEIFTEILARYVSFFCNTKAKGSCPIEPASSDVEVVILPGFPRVNSPLELRFLIRLRTAMNSSVTLPREGLHSALESFLRNISDAFRIEFTVHGNLTEWGPWGPCGATCAPGGTQMRYRNCTNPPPINNGSDCQGPRNETQQCNVQPCPVDGNFTNWGPWGPCSAYCAGGTQMRYRNCTNPPPINNGSDCQGPRNETQQCNVQPCPGKEVYFFHKII
ncbi:mucin-like protein isoform X1 [Oculina patagonica]